MGKLKTSFAILNILSDHEIHTAYQLAKATATTEKIVRSYIHYMRNEGIEIHTFRGHNGGYKLIDCTIGYDVNNNFIEDDIKVIERSLIAFRDFKEINYYNSLMFDLNILRVKIKGIVEHRDQLQIEYEKEEIKKNIIYP